MNLLETPARSQNPPHKILSLSETKSVHKCLNDLLENGAISKCSYHNNEFLSPFFLATKPNGKKRFILNLKNLNQYISAPHFKLEDSRTVSKLLTKNCYLTAIDLKDAYFLLPIHPKFKKYLRFINKGQRYEFNCLPFGLNVAPYIFTKIMKEVTRYLRRKNILLVVYLDDILIIGSNKAECQSNTVMTATLLQKLGFIINIEKSQLIPSQTIQYLGFLYDTTKMLISLPNNKIKSILKLIHKTENRFKLTIRKYSKLIGTFVATCPVIPYSRYHIKCLERVKYKALRGKNYNNHFTLPKLVKINFNWWKQNLFKSQNIKPKPFSLEIFTDASLSGWGAFSNGISCHGFWDLTYNDKHINFLEVSAALNGLQSFTKSKQNIRVLLRIDNKTAIACINRGGSVKYPMLNRITQKLWSWCEENQIEVFASYIPSKDNKEADRESRRLSIETEYELNEKAFQKITNTFGRPDIDLFATTLNKKCKKFISWFPDPYSITVDAFTVSWKNVFFYAFPPFSVITKTLEKIVQEKGCGIVVVPDWPSQPWYPLFQKLLIERPLHFPPNEMLLISPFRQSHPLHKKISLVAGKLSGGLSVNNK